MEANPNEMYLSFLETGKFSDFTIECQGVEFKVHRIVVSTQSAMLEAARPLLVESDSRRKIPRFWLAILFMYSNDYDDDELPKFYHRLINWDDEGEEDIVASGRGFSEIDDLGLRRALKVNTLVYKCAEMLGLDELKAEASARFMEAANLAYDMDGFEDPLRLLYESTRCDDSDLRFEVTCLCVENYDVLEFKKKTVEVMKDHEPNVWSVSVELLKRLATSSTSEGGSSKKLRLGKVVKLCNRRAAKMDCNHMVDVSTVRAAVVSPSSVVIKCPVCEPKNEG
ncbi:hypothetical protein LTR96_009376 [Exophiala xenobiotica]|nr:hypothetical protein LTR41_007526 [Exophiala xenobiotica]KAK5265472.1 hypothetical protein LTR96_009376 [Exophiala xenobiotica]KAK5343869.1 hypothetical protein LTR98_001500 [Exophiala xenobiotica]KAK5411198.1 hypothetical protein LTR06_006089 [Exophiala xenobiotica]